MELFIAITVLITTFVFIVPGVFMFLWNITMPDVFGLKAISYWQAFRLLLLAGIIFGAGSLMRFNFNM